MLRPHCGPRSDKSYLTLTLSLGQASCLGVDPLSRVTRGIWLWKVFEVGSDRTQSGRGLELRPSVRETQSREGSEDEDSPASLGDPNLFTLDELITHIIPNGCKVGYNPTNGFPRHCQKAVDVLRNEDLRLDSTHHFDKGLIESPSSRVEALALPSMAEVLAWESACDDISSRKGEVFIEKGSNILQMVVVSPSIELCKLLCVGKDVVLKDSLKRKALQSHKAGRTLFITNPVVGHAVPMDNDVL
jgi:hypothetical protein